MKKIFSIPVVSIMLILLCMVSLAYAAQPIENLVKGQMLDQAKEKEQIEDFISKKASPKEFLLKHKDSLGREELKSITKLEELSYSSPYKAVILDEQAARALLSGGNFSEALLNAPYEWVVPIIAKGNNTAGNTVASFSLYKANEQWQVGEVGGYLRPSDIAFSADVNAIARFLKDNNITIGRAFSHVVALGLHMDLLYVAAEQGEFFIPLIHSRDELYGLEHLKIYTRNQFVAAVGDIFRNGGKRDSGLALTYGAPPLGPTAKQTSSARPVIFTIAIVGLVALASIYLFRRIQLADKS
ncbi:MAG: hypothetical protein AB1743_04360 [Actinomycetota bacterium]